MSVRREMTMRQLADALERDPAGLSARARREGWPYRPGPDNGLKGRNPRLYDVSKLPASIRERLSRSPAAALDAAAPELRRLEASTAELIDYREAMRADSARFADGRVADPLVEAEIASLSLEIERNQAAIARARGVEGASE